LSARTAGGASETLLYEDSPYKFAFYYYYYLLRADWSDLFVVGVPQNGRFPAQEYAPEQPCKI